MNAIDGQDVIQGQQLLCRPWSPILMLIDYKPKMAVVETHSVIMCWKSVRRTTTMPMAMATAKITFRTGVKDAADKKS